MFSPAILADKVQAFNEKSPGGEDCMFLKLDDQWGIKCYTSERTRNLAYERQMAMHKVELAPAVGLSFNAGDNYCYLTEVAEPLIEGFNRTKDSNDESEDYNEWSDAVDDVTREYQYEMKEAVHQMREHGYNMWDLHAANFGKLRGKVVCIDFGG